jgi:hypothetical protein
MKNLKKSIRKLKRRKTKSRKTYKGGAAAAEEIDLIKNIVKTIDTKLKLKLTDDEKRRYGLFLVEKNKKDLRIIYLIGRMCLRVEEGKITVGEFKDYLVEKNLPFDKSNFGCVGPRCTLNNGLQGFHLRNVKGVNPPIVDMKFVDMILKKLKIDSDKVLPKQKQKYLEFLQKLDTKDIVRIHNVISKWEDPDITYDNLLDLFNELKMPYITDNPNLIINNDRL